MTVELVGMEKLRRQRGGVDRVQEVALLDAGISSAVSATVAAAYTSSNANPFHVTSTPRGVQAVPYKIASSGYAAVGMRQWVRGVKVFKT